MTQEGFRLGAIVGAKSTLAIAATLIASSATAWYLVAGQAGQMSDMVTGLAQVGSRMPNDASVPIFMTMWLTMMVAMMFPTIMPMVLAHRMVVRHRGEGVTSTIAFIGGYLAIWTAIGFIPLAAFLGFRGLPVDSTSLDWLYRLAGAIVVVAGLYQFTPVKETCLSACRTPLRFIMSHDFSSGSRGAVRAGISHGAFCVGCCWALMSVLVAVGLMNLAWMAGLAVIFLLEKNWRYGVAVKKLVGVGLALMGVLVVVHPELLVGVSGGQSASVTGRLGW